MKPMESSRRVPLKGLDVKGEPFVPELLLPGQYTDLMRRSSALSPHQKLALAIINDALFCWRHMRKSPLRPNRVISYEAEHWLLAEVTTFPFSFHACCDALGWDGDWVRKGLSRGIVDPASLSQRRPVMRGVRMIETTKRKRWVKKEGAVLNEKKLELQREFQAEVDQIDRSLEQLHRWVKKVEANS